MLSLRRRHSRWRVFSILLFLGMIHSGELAHVRVPEETSSTSSSTSKRKDIGSLSDYWQPWLLDTQGGFQPGLDSATVLRRIMPKSVFIAPVLPACAEGYHADKMGRCVKSISINAAAHKDFILERLKLMYTNSQASKNEQKKSTGPLQLNIPLLADIEPQPTEIKIEETFSTHQPIVVPTRNETYFAAGEEKPRETNLHDVNSTTLNEKKSTSNVDNVENTDRKPLKKTEYPEQEWAEEADDDLSEAVDYEMPLNMHLLLYSLNKKKANDDNNDTEENVSMTEKQENSTESSPALLLISPTKLTNVVDDLSSMQNDTVEEITQMSNFTSNTNESTTTGSPDPVLSPAKELTSIPLDEQRDNETYAEDELASETSKPSESQEAEFVYDEEKDDEDYPYSTDLPDEEDSAEGEELLKHGETGMTISTRDVEQFDHDRDRYQRQRNQTADLQKKMLDVRDQVMIRFNDSASMEDKDDAGSNVSSEVSIDGDFIVETTLLDVNTERLQVTTKLPDVTEKIVKDSEDGSKESFGKGADIVPEVVFSQDAHGAVSVSSHGRERTDQLSTRIEELKATPSSSESLLYDTPEKDAIIEIRTSNEKRSNPKESVLQKNSKDFQFPTSTSSRTTMNLDSAESFVRFPDYVRQPQQSSYVRFPSSEANSIHSLNYKQNSRYPAEDIGPYDGTSTKSSVPIRQKPVYHLTALSWKPNRSQPDRIQATASNRQNRRPDLVRFWSKLPLIKDPAIYPVQNDETTDNDQEESYDRSFRARPSRRLSPFTSPGNRVSTQKRKSSISV